MASEASVFMNQPPPHVCMLMNWSPFSAILARFASYLWYIGIRQILGDFNLVGGRNIIEEIIYTS